MDEMDTKLQEIGARCAEGIAEMVAALNCDYDRLEYLRDLRAECKEHTDVGCDPAYYEFAAQDREELAELEKAAGDCESQDDARERIKQDALEITLSGRWQVGETPLADRAYILLSTGGPATRIVCELDERLEPIRAYIEAQDWHTPWIECRGDAISEDDLLTYCRCFYFGEG